MKAITTSQQQIKEEPIIKYFCLSDDLITYDPNDI
jgi:hypothetical protein